MTDPKINVAFLNLLVTVADDGELSKDEIFTLGRWINENKPVRDQWPVNKFYSLMRDTFLDGKLEPDEARQIARLLETVLKDWKRIRAKPQENTVGQVIELALKKFDHSRPSLPSLPLAVEIDSVSEKGVKYKVNLRDPSCNCPDFTAKRQNLPPHHVSRCCKHILQAYNDITPKSGWPGWFAAYVEHAMRPAPCQLWRILTGADYSSLVSSPSRGWANIYINKSGVLKKYGYNVEDERWSWGDAPEDSDNFIRVISSF